MEKFAPTMLKRLEINVLDVAFRDKIKRKIPKRGFLQTFPRDEQNVFLHVIRFICHTIKL